MVPQCFCVLYNLMTTLSYEILLNLIYVNILPIILLSLDHGLWSSYSLWAQSGFPCFVNNYIETSGGGNGIPLEYSCWENPIDRGAWWATVYGVAKS